MPTRLLAVAAFLMCVQVGPASAGLIAYEGFDYRPGTNLRGTDGGFGFAGAWSDAGGNATTFDHLSIADESLAANGLATSGGRATANSQETGIAALTRRFGDGVVLGAGGTTTYFSVLFRPEGVLGGGRANGFFGLALESAVNPPNREVFFGKPGSSDDAEWAVEEPGGRSSASSGVTPQVGRTDLLVLKAEWNIGEPGGQSFDRLSLFVNPTAGEAEPAVANAVTTAIESSRINGLTITSAGAFSIDEIRVGTTFSDVAPAVAAVPEPSAVVLVALGLLPAAVRRRHSTSRSTK